MAKTISVESLNFVTKMYANYRHRSFFLDKETITARDLFEPHIDNPLYFMAKYCPGLIYSKAKEEGKFDCIEPWQIDFLYATFYYLQKGYKAIKKACVGGKSSGKSFIVAIEILWALWRYKETDSIIKAFSGKEEQIKSVLFGTLSRLVGDSKNTLLEPLFHEKPFGLKFFSKSDIHDKSPRRREDKFLEACTWSKHNPDALSGDHAHFNMYILDEGQAISNEVYPYLQGIFGSHSSMMLITGNGTQPSGTFANIIKYQNVPEEGGFFVKQVDLDDCIRTSINVKEIKDSYAPYGQEYLNIFYHGAIGTAGANTFFNIVDFEDALMRGKKPSPRYSSFMLGGPEESFIGCDLAYGDGGDATVAVRLQGFELSIIYYTNREPLDVIFSHLKVWGLAGEKIIIDGDGPGKDMGMRLINNRPSVSSYAVHNKSTAANPMYHNIKSHCYGKFRAWLSDPRATIKSNVGEQVLNQLRKEVGAINFEFKDGKKNVADKKEMSFSPDITDACAYAFLLSPEIKTVSF